VEREAPEDDWKIPGMGKRITGGGEFFLSSPPTIIGRTQEAAEEGAGV